MARRRQEATQPDPTVVSLGLDTRPGGLPPEVGEKLRALEEESGTKITIQHFPQFSVFQAEAKRPGAKSCAALACAGDPKELYEALRDKLASLEEEKGERDASL